MVTVTVVGCGNLGSALLKGLAEHGDHELIGYDVDPDALEGVEPYCARTTTDLESATQSPIVVLAVKPSVIDDVLQSLDLTAAQTLVTAAAGVPKAFVENRTDATVVRIMPNLAAETGTMATAVTWDEPNDDVAELLEDLGEYEVVDEDLMNAATALNGSGPAFVFYFIQAMKSAAVEAGFDPDEAETLSAQTFRGAARTVLESEQTVDELIDAVCSPNGTTIEGMEVLWDSDVESVVGKALFAALDRSAEIAEGFDGD
ncbi:MAG: pyrroline-5-carboxylate reductase [Halanaeroarchaeum sp.]